MKRKLMNRLPKKRLWGAGTLAGFLLLGPVTGWSAESDPWRARALEQSAETIPVVISPVIEKTGRLQLMAPSFGFSERGDFYNHLQTSFAGRYHFSQQSAWELVRATIGWRYSTDLIDQVDQQTDLRLNARDSRLQLSSSYVFSPIYGKYGWGNESLIRFDLHFTGGLGARFADSVQPFAVLGLGSNHYIWRDRLALVPEMRMRYYRENRQESVGVLEGLFQVGASWLF